MLHSEITRVTGLDRKAIEALPSPTGNVTAGSIPSRRPAPAVDAVTAVDDDGPVSEAAGAFAAAS